MGWNPTPPAVSTQAGTPPISPARPSSSKAPAPRAWAGSGASSLPVARSSNGCPAGTCRWPSRCSAPSSASASSPCAAPWSAVSSSCLPTSGLPRSTVPNSTGFSTISPSTRCRPCPGAARLPPGQRTSASPQVPPSPFPRAPMSIAPSRRPARGSNRKTLPTSSTPASPPRARAPGSAWAPLTRSSAGMRAG